MRIRMLNGCDRATGADWEKAVVHSRKEEEKYWIKDGLEYVRPIKPIIIDLNDDSEDEMEVDDES